MLWRRARQGQDLRGVGEPAEKEDVWGSPEGAPPDQSTVTGSGEVSAVEGGSLVIFFISYNSYS